MPLSPALRKAAVFVSTLDNEATEAIFAQLSTDDAAKIRSALVELNEIPADEQQQVLTDFLRDQGSSASPAAEAADGVTLDLTPALEAAAATITDTSGPISASVSIDDSLSFGFLAEVDATTIAGALKAELPQTVAVVVAHLSPEQAAAVLQELPPALATEALERIAWIDEPAQEIQAELIRVLRSRLAPHIKTVKADASSLAHLSAVLAAMDHSQRQHAVQQLGRTNRTLLDRLGFSADAPAANHGRIAAMRYRIESQSSSANHATPDRAKARLKPSREDGDSIWLTFDDLLHFDDASLRAIFAATDTEVALLALTGAEPRLIARILRRLPPREANVLRHRLEHPGPLRLRDVEQARLALAAVASRLAHEGTIELPISVRFAAAI